MVVKKPHYNSKILSCFEWNLPNLTLTARDFIGKKEETH